MYIYLTYSMVVDRKTVGISNWEKKYNYKKLSSRNICHVYH